MYVDAIEGDVCSNVVGTDHDDVCGAPAKRLYTEGGKVVARRCHKHRWKDVRPGSDYIEDSAMPASPIDIVNSTIVDPAAVAAFKEMAIGGIAGSGSVQWDGTLVPPDLLALYDKPMLIGAAKLVAHIAETKGFDKCTWENFPLKLMFVVTEVEEALQEMDAAWDDTATSLLAAEMADIAIRTLAILGTLWPDDWNNSRIEGGGTQRKQHVPSPHQEPATLFRPIVRHLCDAIRYWRNDDKRDAMQCLEFALLDLYRLSDALKIDLNQAIRNKCKKNLEREKLHGKKRSEA